MTDLGWTVSEPHDELFAALVAAVGELSDVKKTESAEVPTKAGGKYTYTYATLAEAVQAVRPVASKHGLAVLQVPSGGPSAVSVSTLVLHSSGQWLSFDPLVLQGGAPQETGSAISYARRYQLLPALGLATEDDDAQKAQEGHRSRAATKVATKVAKANGPSAARAKLDSPKATDEQLIALDAWFDRLASLPNEGPGRAFRADTMAAIRTAGFKSRASLTQAEAKLVLTVLEGRVGEVEVLEAGIDPAKTEPF